jgi:hypothetical protein
VNSSRSDGAPDGRFHSGGDDASGTRRWGMALPLFIAKVFVRN